MRTPIIISIIVLALGVAGGLYITLSDSMELCDKDLVSTLIQLSMAVAASISVAFIIYSYVITNQAFVLSQMPRLLLQAIGGWVSVANGSGNSSNVHMTRIHYENRTNNAFDDLSIIVTIRSDGSIIDLGGLFSSKMYMSGGDIRDRRFNTHKELLDRGFDLVNAVRDARQVFMLLEYTHSFASENIRQKVQEYVWNTNDSSWSIK